MQLLDYSFPNMHFEKYMSEDRKASFKIRRQDKRKRRIYNGSFIIPDV